MPYRNDDYLMFRSLVLVCALTLTACSDRVISQPDTNTIESPEQVVVHIGTIPTLPFHGLLGSLTLPGYRLTPFGAVDRIKQTLINSPVSLMPKHGSLTATDDDSVVQCYHSTSGTMMINRSGGADSVPYALSATAPWLRYCNFAYDSTDPVLLLATDQTVASTAQQTTHVVSLQAYQRSTNGWQLYSSPLTVSFEATNLAMRIYTFAGHIQEGDLHLCLPAGKHLKIVSAGAATSVTINDGEHFRCLSYGDDWLVQQRTGLYLVRDEDQSVATLYETGANESIVAAQAVYESGIPRGVIWLNANKQIYTLLAGEEQPHLLLRGAGAGLSAAEYSQGQISWFGAQNGLTLNFYSRPLS